ncbi:MAG: SAM-dependent methyltransferase [Thermonemataceae bacterium]
MEHYYNKHTSNLKEEDWFATWFDSPYYHILYKNRDDKEAQFFMDNLSRFLGITDTDKILDLACGKGRHAIYLNEQGFEVVGVDLSEANIKQANEAANDRLQFFIHDMREVFQAGTFDYVLNLFTSFGYFDTEEENIQAIKASATNLKEGGQLVIDFLNPAYVIPRLVENETKTVDDITFYIQRFVEEGYIVKNIAFEDRGHQFEYQERVKAIDYQVFLKYFKIAEVTVKEVFGNYHLTPFHATESERLIFVLSK